jgi:pimeloyl-ACP methyl ester carboxylesterase
MRAEPAAAPPRLGHLPGLGLSYLEAGAGAPVLFLHGWAGFKEIWWGTLRALSPRFHGIALDWPGHAGTPPAEAVESLSDLARLATDACAALRLSQVTVIGHSMGARVAALMALREPERVGRLVLVAPALSPGHLRVRGKLSRPADVARVLAWHERIERGLGRMVEPAAHDHGGGFLRPFLRRARHAARADAGALHRYAVELHRDSLGEALGEIRQPTLVVAGALDPLVRLREARRSAHGIPGARLHVIPRAMHTPMDDRPAEFHRVLLDFLGSVSPAASRAQPPSPDHE